MSNKHNKRIYYIMIYIYIYMRILYDVLLVLYIYIYIYVYVNKKWRSCCGTRCPCCPPRPGPRSTAKIYTYTPSILIYIYIYILEYIIQFIHTAKIYTYTYIYIYIYIQNTEYRRCNCLPWSQHLCLYVCSRWAVRSIVSSSKSQCPQLMFIHMHQLFRIQYTSC